MKAIPATASSSRKDRRELEIVQLARYVASHPRASISDVILGADAIGPSCRTSYLIYLSEAIDNGWLEKEGVTNGTRYYPTAQFLHHVAMSDLTINVAKRSKVAYTEEFLASYIPNKSAYLTQAQQDRLQRACPAGSFNASDPNMAKEIRRFMADITHNSASFEGVQLKQADTIAFLEDRITSKNISPMDAAILRNHYNCIRFILDNTHHPKDPRDMCISEYDCRCIHSQLSDGLLSDRRAQGRLRIEHVEIRDSCYIPPSQPDIIAKEFASMIEKAAQIKNPFEQSLFLLVHIPYIQPFEDCNKRTSRLMCNIPLLSNGILPVSWADVAPRDYTDALLCVYEKRSTYGLASVFTESCLRSFERFDLVSKERQPANLEITHAKQLGVAIRNRIIHGDDSVLRDVEPIHQNEFEAIVADVLAAIKDNDMVAIPYRIRPDEVAAWRQREKMPSVPVDAG